jgi:superfamily II DNA/RNA helicase
MLFFLLYLKLSICSVKIEFTFFILFALPPLSFHKILDMGFIKDIRKILRFIPRRHQTMLFSATLPDEIKHLVSDLLNDPLKIMISSGNVTVEKINQSLYFVDKVNKAKLLIKLLEILKYIMQLFLLGQKEMWILYVRN